jgi:hypothetical protein
MSGNESEPIAGQGFLRGKPCFICLRSCACKLDERARSVSRSLIQFSLKDRIVQLDCDVVDRAGGQYGCRCCSGVGSREVAGGNLDLAIPNGSGLTILLGNGDGTFTAKNSASINGNGNGNTQSRNCIVGADFDGDGLPM